MARNYNTSKIVYVPISTGAGGNPLKYGFRSRIKSSLLNNLGQIEITAANLDIQGLIFGANSPKPPRASKEFATGTESSFCDASKAAELRADNWTVTASKVTAFSTDTTFSKAYKVTLNGITYAFQSADLPSGFDVPGLDSLRSLVDANDTNLVWGADFPKPPRITKKVGGSSFSTFIDPSKVNDAKAAGFRVSGAKSSVDYFKANYLKG